MASCLADTEDKANGIKLSKLLIDGGTEVLRSTLDSVHPPATLAAALHTHLPVLTHLRHKRILNSSQWDNLFPSSGAPPDSKQFDITLLYILLRNICGISPPVTGWDSLPSETDTTLEANLARIKYYRNKVYGHISSTGVQKSEFELYWKEISGALVALGLDQIAIDLLKSSPLGSIDYIRLLQGWAVEEQALKEVAENTRIASRDAVMETQKTRKVAERAIQIVEEIKIDAEKTGNAVERLRSEVSELKQTSQQIRSEASNDKDVLLKLAKCDFTGKVKALNNYRYPGTRTWILTDLQQLVNSEVNQVFVITARPGVGKSVLAATTCQIMHEQGQLAACHFIEHNNSLRNSPRLIIESLASHLCDNVPGFDLKLKERLSRNVGKELSSMSCRELFTLLLEEPVNAVERPVRNWLVVVDALDEVNQSEKGEFVKALFHVVPKLPKWVKLFITTRPVPSMIPKLPFLTVINVEEQHSNNIEDITLYLRSHLHQIYHGHTAEEVQSAASTLAATSDGIFLFAHFAIDVTKLTKPALSQVNKLFPNGVSSVYEEYFSRLMKDLPVGENKFFHFLEAIVCAESPLPKFLVLQILGVSGDSREEKKTAREALSCLSHMFPLQNQHFTVFHKSLVDWLIGSEQEEHYFSVQERDGHRVLATHCLVHLQTVKNHEHFPPPVNDCEKYALRFGFHHMLKAGRYEEQLKECVLDLDILSAVFIVSYSGGMWSLLDELKCMKNASQQLEAFIAELKFFRFAPYMHYPQAVLQAATCCTETSELRKRAEHLFSTPKYSNLPWIEFLQPGWELPSDVCWVDDFKVSSNTKVAVCLGEKSNYESFVATFEAGTRKCIISASRYEVAFRCAVSSFENCATMALATDDGVKLIDMDSLQTLELYKTQSLPFSCCFLSYGTQLAVGYRDCKVRVWDLQTGTVNLQLEHHIGVVILCTPLSHGRLLTGDWSGILLLWHSLDHIPTAITLTNSWSRDWSNNKETAVVSPDMTRIAALCRSEHAPYGGCVINLYSSEDGKLLMQLMGGTRCVLSFIGNNHFVRGEINEIHVMNITSKEIQRLCCPRQLCLRSSPYQVAEMEFVATFSSTSGRGDKLMGFKLHNLK